MGSRMSAVWIVEVACSDPACEEQVELLVADPVELDRAVCGCGHCFVVLSVSNLRQPDHATA